MSLRSYLVLLLSLTTLSWAGPFEQMAHNSQWHRLLHYKKAIWGGYQSEVDGKNFFLSSRGQRNPEEELAATLEAMGKPDDYKIGKLPQHPQCAFPARFRFLKENNLYKGPTYPCPDLDYWMRGVVGDQLKMIFASSYPNNPASAFGHTFLRIDSTQQKDNKDLLQYGVNYAATTDTSNGLGFALKGLFGLYEGHFSIMPYYLKVNEYRFMESRDIWEYSLNLTKDQINKVLLHLWELENNGHFDYYFLDENCSYHLLGLLDVASPGLNLQRETGFYVMPIQTVQILKKKNLISDQRYRPSLRRERDERVKLLSKEERTQYFRALTKKEMKREELPKGNTLDALITQLQYAQKRRFITPEQNKTYLVALSERSKDDKTISDINIDWPTPPEEMLPQRSFEVAQLSRSNGNGTTYSLKLGGHDLLSNEAGAQPNSELKVGEIKIRSIHRNINFEKISLVDVSSFYTYRLDDPSFSWKMKAEAARTIDLDCQTCLMGNAQGAVGLTVSEFEHGQHFYMMAQGNALASTSLPNQWGYAVAPLAGHLWRGKKSASQLEMAYYMFGNVPYKGLDIIWRYSMQLTRNVELRMSYQMKKTWIDGETRTLFEVGPRFNF